jgi:hypothetical protein
MSRGRILTRTAIHTHHSIPGVAADAVSVTAGIAPFTVTDH